MTRSIVSSVLPGIAALVGALDVFEGKFLLRSSDLLSTDHASAMPSVEEAENSFPVALALT